MTPRVARLVLAFGLAVVGACARAPSDGGATGADGATSSGAGGDAGAGGGGGATNGSGGATVSGPSATAASGSSGCSPGATRECYSGPPETRDVSVCKAGLQTCLPDGSDYGPCEGETLPALETCLTPIDDDCDGKINEAGEGCECKPNATFYCYDGPSKTENVGLCIGGLRTCSKDGTAWGPCIGQTLPKAEDCSTPDDEDCDGATPPCPLGWLVTSGDAKSQMVHDLALDADGNTVLVGQFDGTIAFGTTTLTSAGLGDAFVAKLDPTGKPLWAFRYGDAAETQAAQAVALDAQGNVFVTGYFRNTIEFGASVLTSAGGADVFVAKLSGNSGTTLWATRFGNVSDDQLGLALTVDAVGNPFVAGTFAGTLTFTQNITSAGLQDGFVARLDGATGTPAWGTRFGGTDYDVARGVALDESGGVIVVGDFLGAFSIGASNLASAGATDVLVARFDANTGNPIVAKRFGGAGHDSARSVAIAAGAGPVLTGEFEEAIDFGGAALTSAGGTDVFVAELDVAGKHVQSRRFGGFGDESARRLALDGKKNLLLGGFTTGTVDFGAGPVSSAGGRDILLTKLDAKLNALWTRRFGDASFYQQATAVAYGPKGEVRCGGFFAGTVDFGTGPTMSAGGTDAFVLAFPP